MILISSMRHLSFMLTLFMVFSIQIPLTAVTSVIDGLKRLYIEKLKPLEVAYKFNDFVSPLLVNTCVLRVLLMLSFCGITFKVSYHLLCRQTVILMQNRWLCS
jgi:hypothetical protein